MKPAAFCFDLDGTITSREILPVLARELGCYEEMMTLTHATVRGVIPFERSFRLRCDMLSGIPISRVQAIIAGVPLFARVAGFLKAHSDQCYVVTGNLDVWVQALVAQLGVRCFSSVAATDRDRLMGIESIVDKGEVVKSLRGRHDRIVAVGDGMGDAAMFESADVRVAFGGVHDPLETLVQLSDMICFSETALCQTLDTLS